MNISKDLEKVMLDEIAADSGRTSLDPDEDLLEQGLLDSIGIMKLIVFIEATFKIGVNDEEIVPDNFKCINSITDLIRRKM